jgi:hypothetical protein
MTKVKRSRVPNPLKEDFLSASGREWRAWLALPKRFLTLVDILLPHSTCSIQYFAGSFLPHVFTTLLSYMHSFVSLMHVSSSFLVLLWSLSYIVYGLCPDKKISTTVTSMPSVAEHIHVWTLSPSLLSQERRQLFPSVWFISSTLSTFSSTSAMYFHQEAQLINFYLVSILGQAGIVNDFITIARVILHSAFPGTVLGFTFVLV